MIIFLDGPAEPSGNFASQSEPKHHVALTNLAALPAAPESLKHPFVVMKANFHASDAALRHRGFYKSMASPERLTPRIAC